VEFLRAPDGPEAAGDTAVETTILRTFPTEDHDDVLADIETAP
jgi:hypothetical protein